MEILLVEDNAADAELTVELLADAGVKANVRTAPDGEEAMRVLRAGMRPNLILLDLNLPRRDGREMLVDLKKDPRLRGIPVIVLTTSSSEVDIAYELRASAYITKPARLEAFTYALEGIRRFWLTHAVLPGG